MFDRHPVTTPFPVGSVNVYLVGRTVVDPGPKTETAWESLESALEERGLEPADVTQVLITHPHPDHCGLAGRLREAGASVRASPETAGILADFGGRLEYERSYFEESFRRHGMPESAVEATLEASRYIEGFVEDCRVDRELTGGDEVTVGEATLSIGTLAGHAPGELWFGYEAGGSRVGVVGDHVLGEVTPNPLLEPPREPGGERPRVLPAFNDSLESLREQGFDQLLPGHGEPIDHPERRITDVLAAHERRTETVLEGLREATTAYEVMVDLFGELPPGELYPGMSEAIGHLDVLECRDQARRREESERIRYERV